MPSKTITVSFTGEQSVINDLRNSFVAYHGWTSTIPDPDNIGSTIPNPVTRRQALRDALLRYLQYCAAQYEATQGERAARQAAHDAVTAKIEQTVTDVTEA